MTIFPNDCFVLPSLGFVWSVCTALTLVISCECPLFTVGEGVMWLAHDTGPVCGGCRMLLFISCSVSIDPLGIDSSFCGGNPCKYSKAFVYLLLVLPSTGCLPHFCLLRVYR